MTTPPKLNLNRPTTLAAAAAAFVVLFRGVTASASHRRHPPRLNPARIAPTTTLADRAVAFALSAPAPAPASRRRADARRSAVFAVGPARASIGCGGGGGEESTASASVGVDDCPILVAGEQHPPSDAGDGASIGRRDALGAAAAAMTALVSLPLTLPPAWAAGSPTKPSWALLSAQASASAQALASAPPLPHCENMSTQASAHVY